MTWMVYILECADKTLYTGVTNDMAIRLQKHEKGVGAKYTRGRGPYKLIYTEPHPSKGEALKRELVIKSWNKKEKHELAQSMPIIAHE